MQKIQVEVVSNFHCSRIIEESIGPGMICAAPPVLQGTCFVSSLHILLPIPATIPQTTRVLYTLLSSREIAVDL